MALNWQTLQLPIANGLQQKYDVRARPAPALDICRDAQFDELGGLQTRYPFAAMNNQIFGGGTLANCRRIYSNGNELLVFTDTGLYSWNAKLSRWILKGTHLAIKVDEAARFVTTGDQVDCDRAELANTIVYVWCEGTSGYVAALDKATGSVVLAPTLLGTPIARMRVIAINTRFHVYFINGTNLRVFAIDPATVAADVAAAISVGATILSSTANLFYDICKLATADLSVVGFRTAALQYTMFQIAASTSISSARFSVPRTCDGPIAVSVDPTGTFVQVVRGNGTAIQGDLLAIAAFADVFVNQAVGTAAGTPVNQIAACHRSVQNGGAYRCYVWWTAQAAAGFPTSFLTKWNFVDTTNVLGTQANFMYAMSLASRAFDYAGQVYVWLAFGQNSQFQGDVSLANVTQAQNAYLLYRDDAFLCAKSVYERGAGQLFTNGRLPGVALTAANTYAWCAGEKRLATLGGSSTGYAARAPHDVVFQFDHNDARRCMRLGETLYLTGGEILQYDGVRLTECGFHFYPYQFDMLSSGAGSVAVGTYAYKLTWRWVNARGESERSTTATIGIATRTTTPGGLTSGAYAPYWSTHKTGAAGEIAIEFWRTGVNQAADTPFYLASSNDPGATTSPNQYIPNTTTATFGPTWRDERADAVLTQAEINPENGLVLEALSPPAAVVITSTDTRVFLAGVAGDPDRVWYSRLRNTGEVASFNDGLTVDIPRDGGAITAIAFLNDTLVVFREHCIYAFGGDGFDNTGGGQNYGPARIVATDIGAVSMEAVVLAPMGLVFKSSKGWYLLNPSWTCQFIGDKVASFDSEAVFSTHIVESQHQIRILTSARMLVWDYLAGPGGQWGEWTIADGIHSTMWQGAHVYLTATGPKQQLTTYTGLGYGMDAELVWIKPSDLQGSVAVRWFEVLGEFRSTCRLRIRVARDYEYDETGAPRYFDDVSWPAQPEIVGTAIQVRHAPTVQKMEAFKVRITVVTDGPTAVIDLAPLNITTSGTVWSANFGANPIGTAGNLVTMSFAFEPGLSSIDVRDNFAWNHATQRWIEDIGNVGVKFTLQTGSLPTVGAAEAAISALSRLVFLDTNDPTPTKTFSTSMLNLTRSGSLSAGGFSSPAGEGVKLTGLALDVGAKPGIYRRLTAAQKV